MGLNTAGWTDCNCRLLCGGLVYVGMVTVCVCVYVCAHESGGLWLSCCLVVEE